MTIIRDNVRLFWKAGEWEEGKHPRADNGQFGSGSGGSTGAGSGKGKAGKTKRKLQRRAEAAQQATLGGGKAIQTRTENYND